MSAAPVAPRGAGKPPGGPGKPAGGPSKHPPIPTEWRIELPDSGAHKDTEFGGCRAIEAGYQRGPVLGQGTYGEVYLATDLATGERVAAKKIKMDNEKEGFPITAIREIKILSALAGAEDRAGQQRLRDNVIGLREIVRSGSHKANNFKGSIYMMFDYMDHDMTGLLERSQRENRKFTSAQVKCYLKQLFCGLALLAAHDVLHRDLKNANLLVNNRGELKIADFGLARYSGSSGGEGGGDSRMTTRVITLWYRPPELFLGAERYGAEVDMWSAGCIMFELLTGKPLFPGKDEGDQADKILTIVGQPTEASMPGCTAYPHYQMVATGKAYPARSRLRQICQSRGVGDPLALDLLERLLALNPAQRIKAIDAVSHPYFFHDPLPCKPSEMPQFASSHEMSMKRARHEQRYGGQQQGQQQQQAAGARHQQGAAPPYGQGQQGRQGGGAPGGPPAQRQRTQGQYGGPQGMQPGYGGQQPGQQPYRGGGAPAAGGPGQQAPGYRGMPPGGLAAGMMPGGQPLIMTQAQVQQMGGLPVVGAPGVPGMQPGGYAGYGAPRPGGYGAPGQPGLGGARPHPHGGGAQPQWQQQRR